MQAGIISLTAIVKMCRISCSTLSWCSKNGIDKSVFLECNNYVTNRINERMVHMVNNVYIKA